MAQINLSEEITMLYSVHEISMYSKNTSNEQRTTAGSSRTRDLLGRVNRTRAVRTSLTSSSRRFPSTDP
ncbi:hypothetical protein T4D_12271 [Trichinella pseudospiralis]|uniref:Uncharacterized protein n=1 Tax=Trichinella pseudospiralis TaxID=6337 RepID=A0A0V1FU99_TRIPS|nr:hypothetical protein T4D_12271 [Trichinella pseudospiralis]